MVYVYITLVILTFIINGIINVGFKNVSLLQVVPSNKFTLNVHGKSIFPCDNYGGGVPVMFQYPSCILPTSDKVKIK